MIEYLEKVLRKLFIIFILYGPYTAVVADTLATIGWIESVKILPENFKLDAKIDTGADNSSLDVINWMTFTHNRNEWVRFTTKNNNGDEITFERPLEGYSLIKQKITGVLKRPVVVMRLCIGKKSILAQINLAKRKNFKYRMLIGRSFLKGHFLVDSASRYTVQPECVFTP